MRAGDELLFAALMVAGFMARATSAAWADGTLGLDEVLVAVDKAPKLVGEIEAELSKNSLKPGGVTCLGNHWTYLGGGRAAPYECKIGQRSLQIDADRVYFDARGRLLGDLDKADPKRAKTFLEDNFHWTWTP